MELGKFLADYVACKSVSSDSSMECGMASARKHLVKFFSDLSMNVWELKSERHDAVFAETKHVPCQPTILIYGHYDVQPADDAALWSTDPFTLTEVDGRLYGRGASDNKGPMSAILAAVHDIITSERQLNVNLKFLIEGEEEIGSCGIQQILRKRKKELAADFALVADTWSLDEKNIIITIGLRGIVGCEVEVVGSKNDLHSGYGGPILNPIRVIANICSSLHTAIGLVNIPGFYADVIRPGVWERNQLRRLQISDDELRALIGVNTFKQPYRGFTAAETMRFFPTLEFNGITGGFQGKGIKTIIPSCALVKISCRLVPNQTAQKIEDLLMEKLSLFCPAGMALQIKFEQSVDPYLFDVRSNKNPILTKAIEMFSKRIKSTFGNAPIYARDGGSIGPVPLIKSIIGADSLMIGLSTSKDNIHAPNESISISMLDKGREFFRKFLSEFEN
jgi:acetylornithine deacetylase/succinyl-diaminopimelate desuccinylase-like protein